MPMSGRAGRAMRARTRRQSYVRREPGTPNPFPVPFFRQGDRGDTNSSYI